MTVILVALPCWCLQRGGGGGWSLDITTDVYLVVQLRRTSQPPLGVCLGKLLHNMKYIIIWLLNHTKKWSSYWRRFFSFFFVTNPQVKWSFRPLPEIIRFFYGNWCRFRGQSVKIHTFLFYSSNNMEAES